MHTRLPQLKESHKNKVTLHAPSKLLAGPDSPLRSELGRVGPVDVPVLVYHRFDLTAHDRPLPGVVAPPRETTRLRSYDAMGRTRIDSLSTAWVGHLEDPRPTSAGPRGCRRRTGPLGSSRDSSCRASGCRDSQSAGDGEHVSASPAVEAVQGGDQDALGVLAAPHETRRLAEPNAQQHVHGQELQPLADVDAAARVLETFLAAKNLEDSPGGDRWTGTC
ncbi:hypothetical protein DL766_008250 [Monosporascus sp. MC13-8B]|uniref:Uncharacterized protein n=1 Tax=Monosporascus cannonballus TaxID=155416 RepID=A0ABY0GR42_9PEZI|nr:hypothetical protein DL762_010631 [Monosporascus cannonballus]RYO76269.1 hypothetical protein DL763_010609 [Monosporascus cannonballus]RYP20204.1 hypothetical protein DL766_008250 [Monosporascus sp. MC13-8B]